MSHPRWLWLSLFVAFLPSIEKLAHAEPCKPSYEQAFTMVSAMNLRGIAQETNPADVPLKIEVEVEAYFGSRRSQCEEGAYSLFVDRFQSYAADALRTAKVDKGLKARAAIAVIRKSPEAIEASDASRESLLFRQMMASLHLVAAESPMTMSKQQLLDAIESVGEPRVVRRADSSATTNPTTNPTSPNPPVDAQVQKIYAPTVPLPSWAVISLYEMRDHLRRNELGAVQGKLESILTWMKSVTGSTPPQ